MDGIEPDFGKQVVCITVLPLCFGGKTDDDICTQGYVRYFIAYFIDKPAVVFHGVIAPHQFKNIVIAGLDGQGNLLADLVQSGYCLKVLRVLSSGLAGTKDLSGFRNPTGLWSFGVREVSISTP